MTKPSAGTASPPLATSRAGVPLPPSVQAAVARAAAGCEPTLEDVEAEFWRLVERPVMSQVRACTRERIYLFTCWLPLCQACANPA